MPKFFIPVGHGGRDPGAIGPTGIKEKDVVLEIAKKVKNILENHKQEVMLSRDKDIDVNSKIAADMANKWNADYVISIHCNSASNSNATGTETFAYSTKSKGNLLAQKVQKNLVEEIKLPNRGVKYNSSFHILAKPKAPAILVEVAFINNHKEEALLKDDLFLNKAATGIAKGALEHIGVPYTENKVKVNFRGKNLEVEGVFQGNKNYVSIRELLEGMGYKVEWNEANQMVVVKWKIKIDFQRLLYLQ